MRGSPGELYKLWGLHKIFVMFITPRVLTNSSSRLQSSYPQFSQKFSLQQDFIPLLENEQYPQHTIAHLLSRFQL